MDDTTIFITNVEEATSNDATGLFMNNDEEPPSHHHHTRGKRKFTGTRGTGTYLTKKIMKEVSFTDN